MPSGHSIFFYFYFFVFYFFFCEFVLHGFPKVGSTEQIFS